MTSKPNPPVMTHQPGEPAVSASRKKPGGSPKPSHQPLRDALVRCNVNDGPYPKVGELVWTWYLFSEKWQVYTVLAQKEHKFGGPEYKILNTETGEVRWMRYNQLYMSQNNCA